jgi:CheY-specific phosphatase CheX
MDSQIEAIGQSLVEATREVFQDVGVELEAASSCAPVGAWLDPIAVIGFGGDVLRGSVSFEVPWRLLEACHPERSSASTDLADWVGELANLTLGKLKTKLRGRGVQIQLGLPMTFTTQSAASAATTSPQLQYRLRSNDGAVLLRFSAALDPACHLAAPTHADVAHDIELF